MRLKLLSIYKSLKADLRQNKLLLSISIAWICVFFLIHWNSLRVAAKDKQLRELSSSTERALKDFDNKISLWRNHAQQLSKFSTNMTPSEIKLQLSNWSALLESHEEWLATHIVTRRQGFEPSIANTLFSPRVYKMLENEDQNSPMSWKYEIQANALQLTSSFKEQQTINLVFVRSLKEDSQWIQVALRTTSEDSWSTWVVHTFSESLLPSLQKESSEAEVALYSDESKTFLFSTGFLNLRITDSELSSFLESRKSGNGADETQFAMVKKDIWLAWSRPDKGKFTLVQIIPHQLIAKALLESEPPATQDWHLIAVWWAGTIGLIRWAGRKNLLNFSNKRKLEWHLDLHPEDHSNEISSLNLVKPNTVDLEKEFCRQLLRDVGPNGELKLGSKAIAKIQVSPAQSYRGSWWLLKALDQNRIFIAIGDSSGSGLSAITSAYAIRYVLDRSLKDNKLLEDSEKAVKRAYSMASLSAEGILLGSVHSSLFVAIVELDKQRIVFINAGYPSPLLKLSDRKSVLLTPQVDPVGLASDPQAFPRWSNLSKDCQLVCCNIGSRNVDLDELEDSELLKILIYPYGTNTAAGDQEIIEEAA